jgi:hypothetical protein
VRLEFDFKYAYATLKGVNEAWEVGEVLDTKENMAFSPYLGIWALFGWLAMTLVVASSKLESHR